MPIYGRITKSKIEKAVTDGEAFKAGNIWGEKTDSPRYGILPENWVVAFQTDRSSYGIDFVIYSYNTPIAWKLSKTEETPNVWVVPPVKYSQSTTGQQSAVTLALHFNGWKQLANTSWWER